MPGIMLYSFATSQADEIFGEISMASVDAVYVAGGPHPSAAPDEALEHFDYVVIGEGEETLPELLNTITADGDPATVKGIAYKKGGRIVYTERRPSVDLDCYPPFGEILAPIEISRGCPGNVPTAKRRACSAARCAIDPLRPSPGMHAASRIFVSPRLTHLPGAQTGDIHAPRRSKLFSAA